MYTHTIFLYLSLLGLCPNSCIIIIELWQWYFLQQLKMKGITFLKHQCIPLIFIFRPWSCSRVDEHVIILGSSKHYMYLYKTFFTLQRWVQWVQLSALCSLISCDNYETKQVAVTLSPLHHPLDISCPEIVTLMHYNHLI